MALRTHDLNPAARRRVCERLDLLFERHHITKVALRMSDPVTHQALRKWQQSGVVPARRVNDLVDTLMAMELERADPWVMKVPTPHFLRPDIYRDVPPSVPPPNLLALTSIALDV